MRPTSDSLDGGLEDAACGIGVQPLFQPIVALPEARVVGFEALARWPDRSGVDPLRVIKHANAIGKVDELDRSCMDAAITSCLQADVAAGCMLAVNSEPGSRYTGRRSNPVLDRGAERFRMVFELTERHLLQHPRAVIKKVAAIRSDGFVIAMDDVGAQPESLALLDVLAPEIVKLDLQLVQGQTRRSQSQTLAAILAYQERSGALIVAEGIENEAHLERALAVGATLGQGYSFGRPDTAAAAARSSVRPWPPQSAVTTTHWPSADAEFESPFAQLARDWPVTVRTARKEILVALTRHIERQAADTVDPAVVLAALQDRAHLTVRTAERYERLAQTAPLVALFGRHLSPTPVPGVRGVDLHPTDPLCAEWTVATLGPTTASALIAREQEFQPPCDDGSRLFDFVITHDRALVAATARALMHRMV